MSRNLLHKDKLDDFIKWCNWQGIAAYRVEIDYQVARVRIQSKPKLVFANIYYRLNMPEHYTVDWRLENTVRRYIRWSKAVSKEVLNEKQ